MKVILNHGTPFSLAHGGVTNIVHRTKEVLEKLGMEVDFLRWWDEKQKGDILFQFCRPPISLVRFAKASGYKFVVEHVMTGLVSRPLWKRKIQKQIIRGARRFPRFVSDMFSWDSFEMVDMNYFPAEWDQSVALHMFAFSEKKAALLPYGVNDAFLQSPELPREDYLICTATITPRKRVVEVAKACAQAQVPLKVVGKPYAQSDAYFDRFKEIEKTSRYLEHVPHISDQASLAALYRKARGFILLSAMETVSQSAIEAAACKTPLLLSDMDWAHRSFGENAQYCPVTPDIDRTATTIREFYDQAREYTPNWTPPSWFEARKSLGPTLEAVLQQSNDFRLESIQV